MRENHSVQLAISFPSGAEAAGCENKVLQRRGEFHSFTGSSAGHHYSYCSMLHIMFHPIGASPDASRGS